MANAATLRREAVDAVGRYLELPNTKFADIVPDAPPPQPELVTYVATPKQRITLRDAVVVKTPAGCGVALPANATAETTARAIANGAPRRMVSTAASWLEVTGHPYHCLVDPASQSTILGKPVSQAPRYSASAGPVVTSFADIEAAVNQFNNNNQPDWPLYWIAALLMPGKALVDDIPRVRLNVTARVALPVSAFLTGGVNGRERTKALVQAAKYVYLQERGLPLPGDDTTVLVVELNPSQRH